MAALEAMMVAKRLQGSLPAPPAPQQHDVIIEANAATQEAAYSLAGQAPAGQTQGTKVKQSPLMHGVILVLFLVVLISIGMALYRGERKDRRRVEEAA